VSDWSYVTLAYVVAWGGVVVYAVALARRVTSARRLERPLRGMAAADAVRSAIEPEDLGAGRPVAPGWTAEGE